MVCNMKETVDISDRIDTSVDNQQIMAQTAKVEGQVRKTQVRKYEARQQRTGYSLLQERTFEVGRAHRIRRNQAIISRQITYALFGFRRFKNIYLKASLTHFYSALLIANTFHRRVEGISMVISLSKVHYTYFQSSTAEGVAKEDSIFIIKLTRTPTPEDQASIGFHAGRKLAQIDTPITGLQTMTERRDTRYKQPSNRRNDFRGNQQRPRQREDTQQSQNFRERKFRDEKYDEEKPRYEERGRTAMPQSYTHRRNKEYDNNRSYGRQQERPRRDREGGDYEPSYRDKREGGGFKTRGQGIATHHYAQEHLNRGNRVPKRKYSSDDQNN